MFMKGMGRVRGVRGLGDFVTRSWKEENWWTPPTSLIPGVSNTTAAAAGAGIGLAAAAALAAWYFMKK